MTPTPFIKTREVTSCCPNAEYWNRMSPAFKALPKVVYDSAHTAGREEWTYQILLDYANKLNCPVVS